MYACLLLRRTTLSRDERWGNNRFGEEGGGHAMRGELVETRPGKWRLRVFVGRNTDGRLRHVNHPVAATKREAQRELDKVIAEISRGALVTSHSGTVSDLVDRWLEAVTPEQTSYTINEYRQLADRGIAKTYGSACQRDWLTTTLWFLSWLMTAIVGSSNGPTLEGVWHHPRAPREPGRGGPRS